MGGLFAVGAIFGAIPGGGALAAKASVGMGLIGFGIGAFLTGLAGAGKLASFMGVDGSNIGKIMKNVAGAMNELAALPADIGAKVKAVGFLGPAIASLFGGTGIGQILDFAVDKIKTFSNFLFGTDFKDQATSRKNMMKEIVESIKPLKDLDMKSVSNLDKLSDALGKFSTTIATLGKTNLRSFERSIKNMIGGIKVQLDLLNVMSKGGKIGSEYFDGIPETDFKKGFLDPSLRVDELAVLMNKTQDVLNRTNLNYKPAPDLQTSGAAQTGARAGSVSANTVNSGNTNNTYNSTVGNNYISNSPTIDLKDQFGFVTT